MKTSHRIARAGLVVMAAHWIFKAASAVQAWLVGSYLPGADFDVIYGFAFLSCIYAVFLVGEEMIGPAFLPVFAGEVDGKGEEAGWKFANTVLTVQLLVLLIVASAIMLWPDSVIRLFTSWRAGDDPEKYALGRSALRWLAPSLVFLSLGTTTYMLLNGYKRFFLAAFGDAAWKICVLVSVVLGMMIFGMDHRAVIFGLLAGSIAKLLTHLAGLIREVKLLRPSLAFSNPAVKRMLMLMLPLMAGIILARVRDIVNDVKILSVLETDGLIKANILGKKIYTTVGWLIPYAFSIAMFPFFCEMVDRKDRKNLSLIVARSCRMLLSVFIPFALVIVVLARPGCLFLQWRNFTVQEAQWTAVSTACYVLAVPAAAIEYVLMQAFFAHRRMISVTVVGMVFSAFAMGVSYIGIIKLGAAGSSALAVIALGLAASRAMKSVSLLVLLKKNVDLPPAGESVSFLVRTGAAALVSAGACYAAVLGFETWVSAGSAKPVLLSKLAAGALASAAGFTAAVRLVRVKEPGMMFEWAMERLRRAKSEDNPA
ncbi:MAG: lipid II flippase MurJ [Kiritimatiellia bacterium]